MSVSNNEHKNDGQEALVHQQQHEVRYRAAPTWTRALQWAIVGCLEFQRLLQTSKLGPQTVDSRLKSLDFFSEAPAFQFFLML